MTLSSCQPSQNKVAMKKCEKHKAVLHCLMMRQHGHLHPILKAKVLCQKSRQRHLQASMCVLYGNHACHIPCFHAQRCQVMTTDLFPSVSCFKVWRWEQQQATNFSLTGEAKKYRPTPGVIGIFCTKGHERSCIWGYSKAFCFSLNMFVFAFCIFLFYWRTGTSAEPFSRPFGMRSRMLENCDSFLWPISTIS